VLKVEIQYDRAGRSEGIADVIYEFSDDAQRAIAEFNGANAMGASVSSIEPLMPR